MSTPTLAKRPLAMALPRNATREQRAAYMREYMQDYRDLNRPAIQTAQRKYEATHKHVRAAYRRRMGMPERKVAA